MPGQAPVMSRRVGAQRRNNAPSQPQGAEKKSGSQGPAKRRQQGGQGSDTDSGIYHVRSHTLIQRRQPPPRHNRPARDTYFDKVLNNSEASSEEGSENESSYICDECKMDTELYLCKRCKTNPVAQYKQPPPQRYAKQEPNDNYGYPSRRYRQPQREKHCDHRWDDEETVSEDEPTSQPRRATSRPPEKSRRQGTTPRGRSQKPQPKPEFSDRQPSNRPVKQGKPAPPRENRREQSRSRREQEFSDFDSNEDDYNSPRRNSKPRRPHQQDASQRRAKPQRYIEVVERKTTTRPSRQMEEDNIKIRRKPVPDEYSQESWSEPSEHSDNSEETYEQVEPQRRSSRRPTRKEHFQYEDEEPPKPQGRPNRSQKSKPQGPPQGNPGGRRMTTASESKMRTMGARTSSNRA